MVKRVKDTKGPEAIPEPMKSVCQNRPIKTVVYT